MPAVYVQSNLNHQRRMIFSLTATVAQMVKDRGEASVDHLMPELPGFTRRQVIGALQNAAQRELIESCGKSGLPAPGKRPALYRVRTAPKKAKPTPTRVSSVFELGNPKPEAAWPKASGRVYQPLGPWRSEEEAIV